MATKRRYRRDAQGRFAAGGAARKARAPRKVPARKPVRRTPTPTPTRPVLDHYRTAAKIGTRVALAAGLAYSEYRHPRLLALPLTIAARGWNKPPRTHYLGK